MRAPLLALAACAISVAVHAQSPPDKALQGTWDGTGQVATAAMAKTGTFKLRIDPAGFYLQVFRGPQDFVVDWGDLYADKGEYWRKTTTGLEDRGGYASEGDGFSFTGTWSRFTVKPAGDEDETTFKRLATLMRVKPTTRVSDWTMRAAELATLWQADAGLDSITFGKPTPEGLIGPQSSLSIGFYSRSQDQILTMAPTKGGGLVSFVSPRQGRAMGPRPIPVPVADLSRFYERAHAAGLKDRYTNATLRFFGEPADKARVLWLVSTEASGGMTRRCLDVAADKLTDCRPLAGDPVADFNALARRAAAAQQRLRQQWSQGSVGPDLSLPMSIHERCSVMGATIGPGGGCVGSGGNVFMPP
ncbi:MAG: hypothetical protein JNM30_19135 [Rhodospirillales bacterium]|nr:hypothetical protein [Rhodospirillales bacterium]